MKRAFTPLQTIGRQKKEIVSVTGFTPLETIGRRGRDKVSLTGFTLIEIMLVVAVLIVLIGLAVPSILRSRVIAYEATAIANLKMLSSACQTYYTNNQEYPSELTDLIPPTSNPAYIDSTLAGGQKQKYQFTYNLVTPDSFTINADPLSTGLLKGRYFYTDESGVIRYKTTGQAGPNDEIVK